MCIKIQYEENENITNWRGENILKHIYGTGLMSRIYREHLQLSKKKTNIKKWAEDLITHFSKYIYI